VAAEVGDQQITTEQLDEFSGSFCSFLAMQQPGEKSSKLVRQGALSTMVVARMGHEYAEDHPTELDRASIETNMAAVSEAVADLPDDEREAFLDEVRYVLEGNQYIAQAGDAAAQQQLLSDLSGELDVEIDPRFGSWEDLQADGASGSLSVPTETEEVDPENPAAGLPASQTCS
jgi:hypothetical protein